MTAARIVAIVLVFALGVLGWLILGQSSWMRSHDASSSLSTAVRLLWGSPIVQAAPRVAVVVPGTDRVRQIVPSHNEIRVELTLEQRRKGLLWHPTYTADFTGRYFIVNPARIAQDIRFHFALPSAEATYEDVTLTIADRTERLDADAASGFRRIIPLAAGAGASVEIHYRTRGLDTWRYRLAADGPRVSGLDMAVETNFEDIDFVEGSLSPMHSAPTAHGRRLEWSAEDLVTRQDIGVVMPRRLNPGPLAARMTFFAPVCLLFFFVLITAISVARGIDIHPMHYLFVNAGFFAFHLLFAYTIDLIDVHIAFALSAVVSVALVVSYLGRALGPGFPWGVAALGQLVYLVLFSYSFFLEGMTGLTVTIASIVTLAVLMRVTGHLDWAEVFRRRRRSTPDPSAGLDTQHAEPL